MFILHIALQGCLRAHDVQYGITPDTGGHIRYVLELAAATSARADVTRVEIATRSFQENGFDRIYSQAREPVNPKCDIVRFPTPRPGYLAKEQLGPETQAYATALTAYLRRLPVWPDIVHAHYADAGRVAIRLQHELGIPFVFTAHSLGRLKRISGFHADPRTRNDVADNELRRRIHAEEAVLAEASRVIASSRDEVRNQLGLYANHLAERTCVIAPGCSLDTDVPRAGVRRITDTLRPLLRQHDKPPVLALARPVRRKNLAALVRAFGTDRRLRQEANLVIFAGSRGDLDKMTQENAAVRRELRGLIDRYRLHGHVALPDGHEPGDVGAIYHWAAARGGVFANVAFSEPFGLTLIEAARFGLPLVATNRGGPNDIVGRHGSGILVDPQDPGALGDALWRILGDRRCWSRYSAAAARSAAAFDWSAHADTYVDQLRTLLDIEKSLSWRQRDTA